ncbi:MAG: hypothetical protein C4527_23430 [Candidatus Omnitrophota bacterium]|nr:MAG: hypothetical protein C4527_23430 [Candidatus Omnitrophota bacterium]
MVDSMSLSFCRNHMINSPYARTLAIILIKGRLIPILFNFVFVSYPNGVIEDSQRATPLVTIVYKHVSPERAKYQANPHTFFRPFRAGEFIINTFPGALPAGFPLKPRRG